MGTVRLEHIYKRFGQIEVITNLSLAIEDGEFLVVVGPSGCGKTTMLRMIAGLEDISTGELYIDNVLANQIPATERDIAMVFQNFALFPHMTVFDNIAFGLQSHVMPRQEIERRVNAAAEMLELTPLLKRRPHELSGGQRQRVALGHAIVREPRIFLMDEPLLYLDAQLRMQTRVELRRIHQRLRRTTIYVTHDQAEAMTLGDRIVVMNHGVIQQVGIPYDVYDHPANQFVAGFIGSPTMNFFPNVTITRGVRTFSALIGSQTVSLPDQVVPNLSVYENRTITLGLRPEDLMVVDDKDQATLQGRVDLIEHLDNEQLLYVAIGKSIILARTQLRLRRKVGDLIGLAIKENKLHIFDPETTTALF